MKAVAKLADGRLCSTLPMQYAITAALTGDRSHQVTFRAALKERAALTTERLNAIPGVTCVAPTAAFYAMPRVALPPGRTDEDYVLALLRATGVLCVYGSGFGTAPEDGYLRIVFLASPDELRTIYGLMADFTGEYLRCEMTRSYDSDREFTRRLVQTVATVTAVVLVLARLYAAREALMLIYVSALIAMGFSPLVGLIQHRRVDDGRSRVPRTLAILAIYLAIVGALILLALAVVPPAVAQARELWARVPELFDDFQRFLIRYRLMTRRVTLQEAVQNAPAGSGGNAVSTVLVAISSVIGGVFGLITILILSFYLLIEAEPIFEYLIRFVPEDKRARVGMAAREAVRKGQRVAARAAHARRRDGHVRGRRSRPDGRTVLLRRRAHRRHRRNDSHRGPDHRRRDGGRRRHRDVAQTGGDRRHLLSRAPSARGQRPGPENHGEARRRQPGRRAHGAAHRRRVVGPCRRHPGHSDRGDSRRVR